MRLPLAARTKRLAALLNPATPFLVSLRQRDLRRLFAGLVVSQAGDWLYNLALLAFVYERTGSAAWVGITTAARILPEVVLGPIGGVLADRHDRRVVMIVSDVLRAATMAALAVVAVAGGPVVLAPLLAALCTAAGRGLPPVRRGRDAAPGRRRTTCPPRTPRASASRACASSPGRSSAPHCCSSARPPPPSPSTARASSSAPWSSPRCRARPPAARLPPSPSRTPRCAADLAAGWRALREHPDTLPLVGADFVSSTIYGALTVLFVLLGQQLGLGAAGYGYLLSALGVGGVLAANLANRAAASDRPRRALIAAVAAVGVPLVLLALTGSTAVALVLAAGIGAGTLTTEVVADDDASAHSSMTRSSPAPTGSSCPPASPGSPAARFWRRCWSRCSASTPRCSSAAPRCWPTDWWPSCGRPCPSPFSPTRRSSHEQARQRSPAPCTVGLALDIASRAAPLALVTGNRRISDRSRTPRALAPSHETRHDHAQDRGVERRRFFLPD